MRSKVQFSVIDAHSAGAPARVVVAGVPHVSGSSIPEKRARLMRDHDGLRKLLVNEPRGSSEMCGSLILPPIDPAADVGIVFIESGGWPEMCGAGTIGAATVLIEAGMVTATEPVTTVRFDTPAGLVTASATVEKGAVTGVTIQNVPSFMVMPDQSVELPEFGDVTVDIVYGGNLYALVPASRFGLQIVSQDAERLVAAGRVLRDAVNRQLAIRHPIEDRAATVPMIIFTEEADAAGVCRNMVYFGPSGVDRSPGGTGTSARMAQRYYRGQQGLHEPFLHDSIIGSRFEGRLVATTTVGDFEAVVPAIRGRAHITAYTTFLLDPEDPFPEGFAVC